MCNLYRLDKGQDALRRFFRTGMLICVAGTLGQCSEPVQSEWLSCEEVLERFEAGHIEPKRAVSVLRQPVCRRAWEKHTPRTKWQERRPGSFIWLLGDR
jgi:hypothetical protein